MVRFVVRRAGRDLIGVQNLMKKHQAVMGEMAQHEARVDAVRAAGAALRDAGHFAADDIAARLQQLHHQWTQLQEKALQVPRLLRTTAALPRTPTPYTTLACS